MCTLVFYCEYTHYMSLIYFEKMIIFEANGFITVDYLIESFDLLSYNYRLTIIVLQLSYNL